MKAGIKQAGERVWRGIQGYFKDVFIVVFGVMLSFMINEWRLSIEARDDEKEILGQVLEDLKLDSTKIHTNLKELERLEKNSIKVIKTTRDSALVHSFATYENATGVVVYVSFEPAKVGYFELSSQGKAGRIKDKKLLMDIMELHESGYKALQLLSKTHRDYLVNTVYDYITRKMPFPHFNKKNIDGKTAKAIADAALSDEFRHMLYFEIVLKQNLSDQYKELLKTQVELINRIRLKIN